MSDHSLSSKCTWQSLLVILRQLNLWDVRLPPDAASVPARTLLPSLVPFFFVTRSHAVVLLSTLYRAQIFF